MLESLRNASKGWFAAVLIIVLIGSFGLWGVQDMLKMSSAPKIATVGGDPITPERFQAEFARFMRQMENQSKTQMSTTEAKALGLDREALDRMLTRLALLKKADSIGLKISQAQLIDSIKAIPGMADEKGNLNLRALQQVLQTNQLSQDEFLDLVRADMLREQLIRTILTGVVMPAGLDAALNRFRLERRVAEYVLIDPSRAGEIKDPDNAALLKYYGEHAVARYSSPERRAFTVVTLSAAQVASQTHVSDDEVKRAYEANRRLYETPEKRVLEQIRFKTEQAAREAKQKLDGGENFEALAKAQGYKPEDIKLGEVAKSDTTIPPAAFELPLNKISDPVKGPFGWVILRALSSTPGTLKTFDEVKDEIRQKFVEIRSKDLLISLSADFEDSLGGGDSLEDAGAKHKLPVVKVAAIDARGNDPEGKTVEGLPGGEFLRQVFSTESGIDSELGETSDGVRYVFRVDKITPAAKKPFEAVREQVLADWRNEELEKRLTAIADGLVKRGNGGETMDKIAASLGVAPLKSDPLGRYQQTAMFGPDTVTAVHDAKLGAFITGPVTDGKSRVVARLAEINYAQEPADSPARGMYSGRLREAFAGDLAEQFARSVRDEVGVTIDEARFQAFHTGE